MPKMSKTLDHKPHKYVHNYHQSVGRDAKNRLPHTVTEHQLVFIEGRKIIDSCLIANELIEEWIRKGNKRMIIKLGIKDAFNKVDWSSLDAILNVKRV